MEIPNPSPPSSGLPSPPWIETAWNPRRYNACTRKVIRRHSRRKFLTRPSSWVNLLVDKNSPSNDKEEEEEEEAEPAPFSDAPSPVRAVLNRPWPAPIAVPPSASYGKARTLVATAKDIGPPISPEEFAALEDKVDDDICTRVYKAGARADARLRNYIHEHGVLYQDVTGSFMMDFSDQLEEIRYKNVTAEEMEEKLMKNELIGGSMYLSNLALAIYNKRRKVKFELCKPLLCRSFWEDRGFFEHINFVAKCKDKETLFFAEIEDCGKENGLKVRCCVPLDSGCEGGYHEFNVPKRPVFRKGLDFDKCYACHRYLKHPSDGLSYSGGHDSRKKTYFFDASFTCDD